MTIRSFLSLAVLLLAATQGFTQFSTMTVNGELSDFPSTKVVFSQGENMATFKVENGKFSGYILYQGNEPVKWMLTLGKKVIPVYVEAGALSITGSAKSLRSIRIQGTKTENERRVFEQELDNAGKAWRAIQKDTSMPAFYANPTIHDELHKKVSTSFINAHPDSYYSLVLIDEMQISLADKIPYFEKLSPSVKETGLGTSYADRIMKLDRSAIGTQVMNFTKEDINGKPVSITSFRGKYVLIDFWASWCKPCRMEIPNLLIAYDRYKNKNFTILSVTIDDEIEKWKAAVKEEKLPWTQVRDRYNKKSELLDYYGITSIPSTLLIDPNGKIIALDLPGAQLQKKLIEILGKPGSE